MPDLAVELRSPPHDLDAEQAAVGAMMLSPDAADAISEVLTEEDFYRPAHATVFAAIMRLADQGDRPDPVAVTRELDRTGDLLRIGGAPYVHTLVEKPPTAANGAYYASIVAELSSRRRIIEAGVKIQGLGRSPETLVEVRDKAAQTAFDATMDRREKTSITSVGELVGPVLEHLQQITENGVPPGIPTGLADYDRLTGGLHPGQLIIPAGRTSMGKSVITQNWLHNAARFTGRPVILFSVEMSKDEMIQRLLSEVTRVPLAAIREGHVRDDDWHKLAEAEIYIRGLPLYLVDDVRTTQGIRAYCRRFKHRQGDLAAIGVDYLQRLQSLDRRRDRHESVGADADALKDLAQDMAMPVIAPCQLNRGPENRTGRDANRPRLADLRESGNLEQTADVVALLFRPDYYDKNSTRAGEADIIVDKNRNGPTDTVTVVAQLHIQRFCDMMIV